MNKKMNQRRKQKSPEVILALELGKRTIKAVLMRRQRAGNAIEAHQLIPVPETITHSVDLLELALTTLEKTLLRKTRNLTVGVSGDECRITLRELPAADPADLRSVIRKAPAQIFNEKFDHLAFDCSSLGAVRANLPGEKRQTLITAIPRENSEALEKVAARHKCKLWALTVSQISAMETVAAVHGTGEASIGILDIGAPTSTICILRNGELAFVRASFATSNPISGEDLPGDLNLFSPEKMEKQFAASISSLASELRSSLDFFEHNHGALPSVIYVTGAVARHRKMLDLLQRELGLEITAFNAVPEVRIKTRTEEAESIKREFPQLISAVTEGTRLLNADGGLDLLAEQRELLLESRTKPLRGVYALCATLVVGVVGWGCVQQLRIGQIQNELNATQQATRNLSEQAELAVATTAKYQDTKAILDSINAQANLRFFFAPVLGAMQEVPLGKVELTKLRIQEEIMQTAVSRSYTNRNKRLIAAQPARVIRRNTVVLEGKQSGVAQVDGLLSSMKGQKWFRSSLRRTDPVLLKELISQDVEGSKETMLKIEAYAEKDLL
jgi:Tfp pilus assembly PilM family ATPase